MDFFLADSSLLPYQLLMIVHILVLAYAMYVFVKRDGSALERLLSLLLLLFIPIVGSLIYLKLSQRKRRKFSLKRRY
ncbi:hypothetical protein BFP71_07080 [Roseivirga misakiensis]|uniref:Cardiolipin synthase N-terminal domain-containing protein n=1 Tax=Roseivirga misakiensis TaxID=1563681 RepID=A0A1E5T3B0_9BACT|nr:hypothetical protein BFP71_07080 [Roseivirga misakiensis]